MKKTNKTTADYTAESEEDQELDFIEEEEEEYDYMYNYEEYHDILGKDINQ